MTRFLLVGVKSFLIVPGLISPLVGYSVFNLISNRMFYCLVQIVWVTKSLQPSLKIMLKTYHVFMDLSYVKILLTLPCNVHISG